MSPSITYNFKKDEIMVNYENKYGDMCEETITSQSLDATFEYFYGRGLSFAEYCDYKSFGKTFRVSLVKNNEDKVKAKWIESECFDICFWVCSNCNFPSQAVHTPKLYKYCPNCGVRMDSESK